MRRRRIFNNEKVTRLMKKYSESYSEIENDVVLRNRILKLTYPLIEAAMSRKHIYINRDDIRQECVLKIIQALPQFNAKRGNSFAFLWTTICNTCITHNQRLCRPWLSLSTDEDVQQEAEASTTSPYDSPATRHILTSLASSLHLAFDSRGFEIPRRSDHRKILLDIRQSVQTGELFYNRTVVMRRLKRYGLKSDVMRHYLDYTMVVVRRRLLTAKENVSAIAPRQVGKDISSHAAE